MRVGNVTEVQTCALRIAHILSPRKSRSLRSSPLDEYQPATVVYRRVSVHDSSLPADHSRHGAKFASARQQVVQGRLPRKSGEENSECRRFTKERAQDHLTSRISNL